MFFSLLTNKKKFTHTHTHTQTHTHIYIYIYIERERIVGRLERAAASIDLHVNARKMEYMCFHQTGVISTLNGGSLKLVNKFTYLGSCVSSDETDIDTRLAKAWITINSLSVIWKSDLTDKMKRIFFQAAVASILLYGCTAWTLTKRMEKKLVCNDARMLRANPRGNTRQSSRCTATYQPSRKQSKLDEPDMQDTAGDVGTSS